MLGLLNRLPSLAQPTQKQPTANDRRNCLPRVAGFPVVGAVAVAVLSAVVKQGAAEPRPLVPDHRDQQTCAPDLVLGFATLFASSMRREHTSQTHPVDRPRQVLRNEPVKIK